MKLADPVSNLILADYPVGDVTQWFGENYAMYKSAINTNGHNGIDIVRQYGTPLYAVEDGLIASTKEEPTGHGRNVRLLSNPEDGRMRDWIYAHLSTISVKEGDVVHAGQIIGTMGNSGFVVSSENANGFWDHNPYMGTHLHLGVRILKLHRDGWQYSEYAPKVRTIDYDNGFKGRFDPYPLFRPPQLMSTKIDKVGRALSKRVWLQAGAIMRQINL